MNDSIAPSTRIVIAVAERTGVDPADLPPLFDAIDPAALDRLVDGAGTHSDAGRRDVTVSFEYANHRIVVAGDDLEVRPADAEEP